MQRDSLLYIILGIIALVLIGVTIGLQMLLLTGRSPELAAPNSDAAAIESNATNTEQTDATEPDARAVSMVINMPTSTPVVIEVQAADTSGQPTTIPLQPTTIPLQLTSTAVQPTTIPLQLTSTAVQQSTPVESQAGGAEAATEANVAPTESPTEPPPPTETPLPTVAPTDTPIVPVDFVFSYVDGRTECRLVTEVVASLFETWGWSTRTVRFSSMEEVFSPTLYETDNPMQPDLAFCYRDPEDREQFLSQNGTDLELISSGYITVDEQKYYVLAHSGLPAWLRYENPCILNFLKDLSFNDAALTGISDAAAWTAQNIDLVTSWGTCEPEAQ